MNREFSKGNREFKSRNRELFARSANRPPHSPAGSNQGLDATYTELLQNDKCRWFQGQCRDRSKGAITAYEHTIILCHIQVFFVPLFLRPLYVSV